MKLTTFSDYTLRVLMFLALSRDRLATVPEIAAAYGISENHLMKVVHQLARSGSSNRCAARAAASASRRRPRMSGWAGSCAPAKGAAPIVECLSDDAATCRIAPACKLSAVLSRAFDALYATLDEYTLADLVQKPRALETILLRR
jgi:Rrf2 family nitric oxide-sensitive transcriptional repressor